jgi:hypothetical protein
MWRFFYWQAVALKEVLEGLGIDPDLLLSQLPTQGLVTHSGVFDLFQELQNSVKHPDSGFFTRHYNSRFSLDHGG